MAFSWRNGKKTILLVEDEPAARELLVTALGKGKFRYLEAADGRRAIELASKELPNLIVMDIMLPLLSGFDATSAIKADPKTKHIPVLMCTVRDTVADYEKSIAWGASDFISKPYDLERLRSKVDKLLV